MASTYSALKIELIGTGEQSGTWGTTTNTNLGDTALGEAITGSADVAFSSGTVTLTLTDTNASQTARNLRLNLTGTSGGAQNLIVPNIEKLYLVNNGCADVITVKNSSGTGIAVPAGKSMFVFNNATNVVDAVTASSSLNISGLTASKPVFTDASKNLTSSGTLAVDQGGTGLATLTANNVILGNGTSAPTFVAPGTTGNLLTSNGTTWASTAAPTAFVTGMILMWSGTIATIPSGFVLCNGSNSTPDLRDRFIIGATADSGGAAKTNITGTPSQTGGSKDASLPSHTHTATVTDPGHFHTAALHNQGGQNVNANPGVTLNTGNTSTATTGITVANSTEGVSATNANLVPYYALAFIMKS